MTKRISRVRRSAEPAVEGNLVKVDTPAFISLVGKPANQRPFPVIRSEGQRRTRVKRSDGAVMQVMFPDHYTEDDAVAAMTMYGMEGYTMKKTEDGKMMACRSDLQSVAKIEGSIIRLTSDGITVVVDPAQYTPQPAQNNAGVALACIEFDAKRFDNAQVSAWLADNGVDFSQDGIENSANDLITVKRSVVEEGVEVRRMELEQGVVAVVCRAEAADIPEPFVAVINEAAYGSWGWGQLDFGAAMADRAFCEQLEDAQYRLNNVVSNILFYSELPLDVRKQLVTRCLGQYAAFINNAIDSLPRQVLALVARSADAAKVAKTEPAPASVNVSKENTEMTIAQRTDGTPAVVATPAVAAPVVEAPAAAAAVESSSESVSRADVAAIVAEALKQAGVVRSEPAAPAAAAPAVVAAPAAEAAPAAPAVVTRSDLEELLKPLTERLNSVEGTTVVRSEGGDLVKQAPKQENVFRGAFGVTFGKEAK